MRRPSPLIYEFYIAPGGTMTAARRESRLLAVIKGIAKWFGFALVVSAVILAAQFLYGWLVPIIFGVGRGSWVVGGEYHAGWRFIAGLFVSLGGLAEILMAILLALALEKTITDNLPNSLRWSTAVLIPLRIVSLSIGLLPKVLAYWIATTYALPAPLFPRDPDNELMWGYFIFSGLLGVSYLLAGEEAIEQLFKGR